MKKIFIYSMLFLVSLVTSAQTSNVLSIPDIVMPKGQRMLPVNIDNTDVIAGVQFDFQLPDGVTVIGETATLTERCSGHTVTVKNMGSNLYRVMLFAQPTVALTGTSGTVMNIPVDVPMPYVVGDYPLTISNVVLSGMTGNGVAATVSAGTLTITDIPMTVSSAGYTGVYDEAAHGITVTVTDPEGATIKYGTAAGEYTLTENPTYTNVGTYTVYYQVTKQYYITETGSAQVIITKADVTCTPPTALTPVYTGEPLALVAAGTVNGGEMQYSLDGTTWSATIPTGINAGNYRVYYRVIGDANHNDKAAEYIDVTIAKADITYTAPAALNPVYTGSPLALISTGTANGGQIQYSSDGTTWSTDLPTGINAGSYPVWFRIVADANHNDKAAESFEATIAKADVTYTAPTAVAGLVYSGAAQTLIAAGTAEGGVMQYSLDNATWGTELPQATNAGTYPVYFRVVGDANHNDKAAESINAAIAKADVTFTAPVAVAGLVYSGAAQALITAGTAEGGIMQYSLDGTTWGTELPKGTNAGTYSVSFRVVGDANHNDKAEESFDVIIAKADVAFTAPVGLTLVYTGAAQALITAGTAEGGVMQYSLDGTTWGTELPKGTNAGTYSVSFRVVGDANHNDKAAESFNVAIAKADVTYTAPVALTLVYTGAAQTLIAAGTAEGGVMQYSLDNATWGTELPQATNAGTYPVYFRVVGDANHNDQVAAFVNVTINKADMTYTPPVGLTLVYTGELQILIEPGTVEGGVMEYSLDGTTWSIDTPASKDIRTYTVYYRIVADANHNEFNEIMSVEATIKGFPVDIAAGEYVTYYSDRTLKLDEAETDAKLYTVTNVTDKTVVVSEITVAAAETPILVYNNSNVAKTVVLVPTDEAPANIAVYSGFKGTLVTKEMPASTTTDYYGCNGKDFVWIRDAGTVKANRCWLEVPKSVNPAPSRSIVGGGDTTGINAIDNMQLPDGIYYDLNGRCLQGQPTKKGLYIMNGKKVIIR